MQMRQRRHIDNAKIMCRWHLGSTVGTVSAPDCNEILEGVGVKYRDIKLRRDLSATESSILRCGTRQRRRRYCVVTLYKTDLPSQGPFHILLTMYYPTNTS